MKLRFFSIVCALLFLFLLVIPQGYAQSPNGYESRLNSDVPKTMSTHTQTIMIEIMSSVTCFIAGFDMVDPNAPCLGIDPETHKIGIAPQSTGLIGSLGGMIVMTYNLPVSGSDYTKTLASNFGIVKSAEAQGIGFDSLKPLQTIWETFRNFVYMLFVILFMFIGLGVLFRFNLDSRSVMTIQSAVPKAIVTLLLITFSYAIVGFMIDMMFLTLYFLYELFASIPDISNIAHLEPGRLQGSTPFSAAGGLGGISSISWNASRGLGGALETFLNEGMGRIVMTIIGALVAGIVGLATGGLGWVLLPIIGIGGIFGGGSGEIVNYIGGLILFLIISLAIVHAMFRLWFQLIKAYVFILLDVALAPLWIGASLIPGSPLTVGGWVRHVLSYLGVFPIAFMMFLLAAAFMTFFGKGSSGVFAPPMIGDSFNPKHFSALIAMAIILMTPEVIKMSKEVFKSTTENKYQGAVGAAFTGGIGMARSLSKPIASRAWSHDKEGVATGWLNRRVADSKGKGGWLGKARDVVANKAGFDRNRENQRREAENNAWRDRFHNATANTNTTTHTPSPATTAHTTPNPVDTSSSTPPASDSSVGGVPVDSSGRTASGFDVGNTRRDRT